MPDTQPVTTTGGREETGASWGRMARCVLCSLAASRGYLCDAHGKALASGTLTPEQIVATPRMPAATLIDPWGEAQPIDATTAIGRATGKCGVVILHPSVSQHHATITRKGDRWVLVDESSRNGTSVDGKRISEVTLSDGMRIQLGEIAMFFVSQVLASRPRADGPGRTAPTRRDQLIFSARLDLAGGPRIELSQRVEGGVLRVGESAVELGKLEFRLLQVLTESRQTSADPELSYMSWQQLAGRLEFKSHEADSENVRELVRRVRRKLQQAGVEALLESKHGVGYRVSGDPVEGG
jgi:pSer/pThr/pTyr-binding forkhead associated (FHA) protein